MTCEAAFRRLDDYLDRQLSDHESQLVQEHLATCEACTREFSFERSLLDGVRKKLESTPMPSTLAARIAAMLKANRNTQKE